MPKIQNWNREEVLEHSRRPFVWRHGNDETLTIHVERKGRNGDRFYQVVLRRKGKGKQVLRNIGTRNKREDARDLAVSWAENHPNPKEARITV